MDAQPTTAREPAAVVVIGSYLVALVIEVERFPAVGETVNGGGYFETLGSRMVSSTEWSTPCPLSGSAIWT